MPCFCSLFAILGRLLGCLYAIFYRIDTKIGRTFCSAYSRVYPYRVQVSVSYCFIPWFVRDIR